MASWPGLWLGERVSLIWIGVQLLDFCASHSLFENRHVHYCTWHRDTLECRSIIYWVVVSADLLPFVLDTWVKREAELSSDHHVVVSWTIWQGRKLDRPGRSKWTGRFYWERLFEDPVRMVFSTHLRKSFDILGVAGIWNLNEPCSLLPLRLLFRAMVTRLLVLVLVRIPELIGGHQRCGRSPTKRG